MVNLCSFIVNNYMSGNYNFNNTLYVHRTYIIQLLKYIVQDGLRLT